MTGPVRVRLVITGRVQGVGFRRFVERRGRAHGIDGWVRNRDDGSVEILAAGDPASVDALERDVRHGPPGAVVDEVARSPAAHDEPFARGFAVRRD